MNLSITPVNVRNNYSATPNCKRNNNQAQNFEGLQARVFRHPEDGKDILKVFEKRDKVVDRFMCKLEEVAQQLGVNTNKMEEQGYSVEFVPKFAFSSKMSAILKNKDQNIVQGKDHLPVMTNIHRGNEFEKAEEFANILKDENFGIVG